jgi:hypothetical protein
MFSACIVYPFTYYVKININFKLIWLPLFKMKVFCGLSQIKEVEFPLEKDIQKLIEKNGKTIFGLELLTSEFQLNELRLILFYWIQNQNHLIL